MPVRTALQGDVAFRHQLDSFIRTDEAKGYCVVAADINHFKLLNEWYGWNTGDSILQTLAQRFSEVAQLKGGFAGYFGNDDFMLVLPDDDRTIRQIRKEAQSLIALEDKAVVFSLKLGVCSIAECPGADGFDLCNYAQIAASLESEPGVTFSRFDAAHLEEERAQLSIVSDIEAGLRKDQFIIYLQPQCNSQTRRITGMEALVRWNHPARGLVGPGSFIPVLEKTGLIVELDAAIWKKACQTLAGWLEEGKNVVPISVNVSIADIQAIDVEKHLTTLCAKYKVPHNLLRVEVTESMMAQNMDELTELTSRLRQSGYRVLMDDFGSGYSSLNMLKDTNVDVIKLDMKLIELNNDNLEKGRQIVEAVVAMAHQIGLPVIAEGVENHDQLRMLQSFDCIYVQGFKFFRPMPVDHAEALLAQPGTPTYWDLSLDSQNRNIKEVHYQFQENLAAHVCQLMGEYLGLFGRVNVITGNFELVNRDPAFPAPSGGMVGNLQEYADMCVEKGLIAPEFVREYQERTNLERARSLVLSGSLHRLFTIRTTLGGDMEWLTIGFIAPADCSGTNPWAVFFARKESFTTLPASVLGKSYDMDTLTGLYNVEKYKSDLHELPHTPHTVVGAVYLDVIGLHEVNNHLGHAAGDEMLSNIGRELRFRFPDANCYRLGGDEFLVVILGCGEEELNSQLDLSIRSLRSLDIVVSCGVAASEEVTDAKSLKRLVEVAEQRMFDNKRCQYADGGQGRQLRVLDQRLEDLVQERNDMRQSFAMMLPMCTGVYVVNMLDDTVRCIRAPEGFERYLTSSKTPFTYAARNYAQETIVPKYQSVVLDLLDFNTLRELVWNGQEIKRYFETNGGTRFNLEVHPYSERSTDKDFSLWVFTKLPKSEN